MKTNQHIIDGIETYLSSDSTDYAVMICGEWGMGKTYFLKQILCKELFKQPVKNVKTEVESYFRDIYVSLAGMTSLETLESRMREKINIFFPFNRENRVPASEAYLLEEFLSPETRESDVERQGDWMPSDIILCFDDLERMDPSIMPSVLSYISVFTEHRNIKVVFLCAEDKMDEKCNFPAIKEKYIRYTFRFEPIIHEVIEAERDLADEYKLLIKRVFERAQCYNIRTLKQVLNQFNVIDTWVKETRVVPSEWLTEVTKSVTLFQCFYTIEKNRGRDVSILNIVEQNKTIFQPGVSSSPDTGQVVDDNSRLIDQLQRMYMGAEKFFRFESLANYFTKGLKDESLLANELVLLVEELDISAQNSEVADLLDKTKNIHLLSTNEFSEYWKRLLEELPKGNFTLVNYLEIYKQLLWLESLEIKGVVIEENITELFRTGIRVVTGKNTFHYIDRLKEQNSVYEYENRQKYNEFLNYVEQMNAQARNFRFNSWSNCINEAFKAKDQNGIYAWVTSLTNLAPRTSQDAVVLFDNLRVADSSTVNKVVNGLLYRYANVSGIDNFRETEKDFIDKLSELIKEYLEGLSEKTIETVNFFKLDSYLDQLINLRKSATTK